MYKIILFFTYGVSLKTWAETGLLQREIRLYQELILRFGVQVQFITYGDSSDRRWEKDLKGIHLLPVYERFQRPHSKILSLLHSLFIPWIFRRELQKADLFKTNQIWGSWIAILAKWFFQKPLIVRCGYEFYDFSRKQNRSSIFQKIAYIISWLAYTNADLINVASVSDQILIEKEFKIDKALIEYRPNWIDTAVYKNFSLEKNNRVLFVGRLNDQKNIPLLLDSMADSGITLDIVGDGELKDSLKQLVLKKNVKVNFLGSIPNNEMPEHYNMYKVYVLCSRYEGNPKTLLEAMACEGAVIGTDVPGISEVVRHEKSGLLVQEDQDSLRSAILRLMSDQILCAQIGQQARRQIIENNSLESALSNEYSAYNRLDEKS